MEPRTIDYRTANADACVLIIDDNPNNIKLLQTILSVAGYSNIHTLTDSYQAANRYRNLNPDVVLLDLKMPGLDGFQLLEIFKDIDLDGFVPVLMLTSEESKATKLKALHAGVKDFLTKPFDRLEVLFRINNLIETHHLYKSLQERNRSLDDIVRERTSELKKEITVRREAEQHIRHQALHDNLTGLPNRSLLRDRLQQDIYNASRNDRHVSVLLIDIDRFSEINNTLGHRNGDILLMQIAQRLHATLRHGDTVARYERQTGPETVARSGGNAFTVTLPMLPSIGTVNEIVSRIREIFTVPFDLDGFELEVSARISIVHYPEHGDNAELLLHRSDVAMYHAKKMHQDCVVYSPELDNFSTFRLTLMSELRHAISSNGLNMHYQPKIDMATGKIIGFEALVRWVHEEHGFIPPDHFVPMAEETGMIRLLSQWVLHTTMNHCQKFSKEGMPGNISVNLSPQDLLDPNLVKAIKEMLQVTALDPELLTLEVTESAMMEDPRNALQVITRISDLGVKFSIDDFGTGYSSLSYLKKLPVAEIKIDKSFVIDMRNNPDDTVIVRSTIDLAHNLGRHVVAEGIEDQKTLQILRELGCDYAQGFYMSEPLPQDSLLQWFERTGKKCWL